MGEHRRKFTCPYAVTIQPDGRIVVAGSLTKSFPNGWLHGFLRGPILADGQLDTSFGTGGIMTTDFGAGVWGTASGVAMQSDGKIVVAGDIDVDKDEFLVIRYNADGTLDSSFGIGGEVATDFGTGVSAGASSVALQSDGKIVAAGYDGYDTSGDFALARYNSDGSPDTSFGAGGKVTTQFGTPLLAIVCRFSRMAGLLWQEQATLVLS